MKHVVALSGGKDSTAMALRLAEVEPRDYEYICTPTGNELPELFDHWNRLEEILGKPIKMLRPFDDDGLLAVIRQQKMIPNFRARFCTRILKIEPAIKYLTENAPVTQYVGLRYDEELRNGIYGSLPGVWQEYPLRNWGWGVREVLGYLADRGVTIPQRTDCGLCFFQRIGEWKRLWKEHSEAYLAGVGIEKEIGGTLRTPGRDTWPTKLEDLAKEFASGRPVRGESKEDGKCRVCSM